MKKEFDLRERTALFAEKTIDVLRKVRKDEITSGILNQCMRSVGSVGANYCEASEGESVKDFVHKIRIAKKETKESQHWFRLLAKATPELQNEFRILWKEAQELVLIFAKSIETANKKIN